MIYLIMLITFSASFGLSYWIFRPISDGVQLANQRSQYWMIRQLEAMFIFVPKDFFDRLRMLLLLSFCLVVFILSCRASLPIPFLLAGFGALAGFYLPEVYVAYMRKRRRRIFSEQLVDGLVLLASGLRAGFSLQQALEMLVEESKAPLAQEFGLVINEYRLGVDLDQALRNCVERIEDQDLDLAVAAINITRQLGGNLSEIFERIVQMVRERQLLTGKVMALTAQGRMQAVVVGGMPYLFTLVLFKVDPALFRSMWTTLPGLCALLLVVALDTIGFLWVRRLVRIKY